MTDTKKIVIRWSGVEYDMLTGYYDEPIGEVRFVVHAQRKKGSNDTWTVGCGWIDASTGDPLFVWTDGRPHGSMWTEGWPATLNKEQLEELVRQVLFVHVSSLFFGQQPDQPKEVLRRSARATDGVPPEPAAPARPPSEVS